MLTSAIRKVQGQVCTLDHDKIGDADLWDASPYNMYKHNGAAQYLGLHSSPVLPPFQGVSLPFGIPEQPESSAKPEPRGFDPISTPR